MQINACINKDYLNTKSNPSFNGSFKKTEQGTPYYNSTSATNVGYVTAAAALGLRIPNMFTKIPTMEEAEKFISKLKEVAKDNPLFKPKNLPTAEELINNAKKSKKYAIPFALIAAALSLGSGVIVDKIRNQKAAETADKIKKLGLKNAMSYDENIDMSRNGRGYYNSDIGNKYGAILGAACGCTATGMSYILNKKRTTPVLSVLSIGSFALGGWLVGKFADHKTNDAARRYS